MPIDFSLYSIIHDLKGDGHSHLSREGFSINLNLTPFFQLQVSAQVYRGDRYIPQAVRQCIKQTRIPREISLDIDEMLYEVTLKYKTALPHVTSSELGHIIEDFTDLANEWRARLDERDRQDHLYVRVK